MSLSKLIQDIKDKGILSVAPIQFRGKMKPIMEILAIMNDTEPEERDPNWWGIRLWLRRN